MAMPKNINFSWTLLIWLTVTLWGIAVLLGPIGSVLSDWLATVIF